MRPSVQPHTRRDATRNDETFHDVLYSHLKSTPWWLISLAFHGLLVLALFAMPHARAEASVDQVVSTDVVEDLDLEPEETKPVPREQPPVDPEKTVLPPETIDETNVAEDRENPDDDRVSDIDSKFDLHGEHDLDGFADNPSIGIGGGLSGAGPGGSRLRRTRQSGRPDRRYRVVQGGLEWLREHQDENGMWDADGFMKHDKVTPICDGAGRSIYDTGVSGLALLAFLGAGHTHKHGLYERTVRRGLKYLRQSQDAEGCFGPRTDRHFIYSHAVAALAMAEAYAMTGSHLFKTSAQRGIDFLVKCQNPYLAWRYGLRPGDNDTSVTGWAIMALKSARIAGLRTPQDAFDGAKRWVEKITEPEYGRAGYTARGTGPARTEEMIAKFPPDKSESLTAVALLTRIFVGEDPRKSEMVQEGADLCANALPRWDESDGSIDMYYWYYGTLAMFQVGGDRWKRWNAAIKTAIVDHQRKDGAFRGSWDPIGPWGAEGGRVYATALNTMCMEVYYRYPRVFGAGSGKEK